MHQNFKIPIFISILLMFTNILPARAEEKATQQGLSTKEWLECVAKVVDEFDGPIKACLEKNRYRYPMCEKIANEQNEASDKEIERRCILAQQEDSPPPNPTEQSPQDQSSDNSTSAVPGYTKALTEKLPKESDFQKIPKTDFKKVNPVSTASATPKPATESANITGSMFIGKVDGDGALILQFPDEREVELKDDKTAIETERPNVFRWRDVKGPGSNFVTPIRHFYVEEVDCHILLEQERRDKETLQRLGRITFASDWNVYDTFDIKPIGDCSYLNNGGPVRVLAGQGQVTFKTPDGAAVSAENADFGIGYDAKSAISIVEVYNGSITVTNQAGNSKTILTAYGSEIKQIEIDKNGVMTETIAIPESQWEAFLASKQEKKDEAKGNTLPIAGALAVFGLGGIAFFLYRTGKLLPLYRITSQKIAEILQKTNK